MHQQALYLEPEKAELLEGLAAEKRIPRAVLLREAVDDLLKKYEWTRERLPGGKGNRHRLVPKKSK